ncbi:interleukin 17 receptor A1a isoform X1 [Platichthys flesus]|uniref:interleukin 17 receptor A1a isoform X1 n=2 Tax=Platichthys flesus TaxID=8260 RepID=UPI002DB6061A|nr:interleukin 17 receptor A1a isoform X1 [Platichthys flesus]XP_062238458.1 interleukin 17 receptor A1a isoform X1 [Platichthys flesus]
MILRGALLWLCLGLSSSVKVLTWPPLNCSTQGLECTITTSNCMDKSWLQLNKYTPSSPEELQASVDTRRDEAGHLQPVLDANWKIRDDGSINYLNATELHVLVMSTNQNLCVRYSFREKLLMRSPSGEKWSFSANMVMLEPGQRYRVSVFNIPKPEVGHSDYDINKEVIVPDCQDPTMQMTRVCIERGSLWRANISLAKVPAAGGRSALAVSFRPDTLCEEYIVIVSCFPDQDSYRVNKANRTTLNATFSLDKWPRSCCQFDVQVKPLFPQCGQDCTRQGATLQICDVKPIDQATPGVPSYTYVILMLMLTCVVTTVISCVFCRKPGITRDAAAPLPGFKPAQYQLEQPPKVLVIYSQDHYLYRDIVLKLCAFLQVKCGAKVLVDLLDSTSVGMVGRFRWLEWQRQQLSNPSDKILVLCSQGVQAKWRALCGQDRVTLREDLLSPTDDMLTPFLHLFLPDMHQAGMQGKYMAAYFDDISSEQDIPSFFDITVKYKLMKHFEELYFRIVDIEKYQPGQVNHIEGIGGDEYFNCPSGRALKNAIENFQAYQLENPDWFERECVEDEEEVMTDANLLIEQLQIPPVLQCVPLIRDGPPVQISEVEITENCDSIYVLTPELSCQHPGSSVVELTPEVNPEYNHQYPSDLDEVLTDHMHPHRPGPESHFIVEPVLHNPPLPRQNWLSLEEEPLGQVPTEDDEDDSLLQRSQPSAQLDLRSSAQQNSHNSNPSDSSGANMRSDYLPPSDIGRSVPLEMDEDEVLVPSGKGPNSGSDQGYISKIPSQHESPFKEEALAALARLQEELFQQDLRYTDLDLEGN